MRLPFYISFFSFLGTLVLAAPVGSASNLVNRDDTGKVCMDPVNFGLTDVGLGGCPGGSIDLTGLTPEEVEDALSGLNLKRAFEDVVLEGARL